jgi:hypothetical protein
LHNRDSPSASLIDIGKREADTEHVLVLPMVGDDRFPGAVEKRQMNMPGLRLDNAINEDSAACSKVMTLVPSAAKNGRYRKFVDSE